MPAPPPSPTLSFFELILSSHAKLSLIQPGFANGWKNHCLNRHHLQSRGRKAEASRERKNGRQKAVIFSVWLPLRQKADFPAARRGGGPNYGN